VNYEPLEVIQFKRTVGSTVQSCVLERYEDGSVRVSGEDIDTFMFEFSSNAVEDALGKIESLGFTRCESQSK